jgi:hypothetical protein
MRLSMRGLAMSTTCGVFQDDKETIAEDQKTGDFLSRNDGRRNRRAKSQRAGQASGPYKKQEVEAAFQKQRSSKRSDIAKITYEVVEHDGGWAYRVNGVFSEAFPTHALAHEAAERAAREQVVAGETTDISYEDSDGRWHEEVSEGDDRPETSVKD